jgi:outer membrane protein TolC
VALDRRQWEMAQAAFELGEVTLFQVLTALRQARASARENEELKLRQERLITQFNQVIGVLP